MFKTGNLITTNRMNGLEVIASNEHDIVVRDLLNGDFSVLSKTGHDYELFDAKTVLKNELKSILSDTSEEINKKDMDFIIYQMNARIDKFIL